MNIPKLTVRVYGDPCLRKKSNPVPEVGFSQRILVKAMFRAMYDYKGVGLAAPQVGINDQIFVADTEDGPRAFFNPKILKKSGWESFDEGCLCLPGISIKVKRPKTVTVQYLDENNQTRERRFTGLMARIFQHETDHLNGKLIIDYAGWREKRKIKKPLEELCHEHPETALSRQPMARI